MVAVADNDEELVREAGVPLPADVRITPMLRQWLKAKGKAKGAVLLFRMGDFYELFGPDASDVAPLLDLAVTTRDRDKTADNALAMAGFPHHAAPQYISRLIELGFKVAVCDQLEDPALARGIVKRDVTRLVTPGMILEEDALDARAHNFLVGIVGPKEKAGLAALDVSTGTFMSTTVESVGALVDEIARLAPAEIVVCDDGSFDDAFIEALSRSELVRSVRRVERRTSPARGTPLLRGLQGVLDPLLDEKSAKSARAAAETVLGYVVEAHGSVPSHVSMPRAYAVAGTLLLDETTRKHLALTGPRGDLRASGTLAHVVDRTLTSAGSRRLLGMLIAPSMDLALIRARHDVVDALVDDAGARDELRSDLRGVYDIERLVGRIASGRASPRDLRNLSLTLERIAPIERRLALSESEPLVRLSERLASVPGVEHTLKRALVDDPASAVGQGPIFREEFDATLDELTRLAGGGRDAIVALEEAERKRTGIASLKVRHTRVFGFYLEVTKTHLSKVPDSWKRKQTVANAERFVTDELARLEEQVATAEQRRTEREAELMLEVVQEVANAALPLSALADALADVDALLSFAEVSAHFRYVRPTLHAADERSLAVVGGRHPVVEAALKERGEAFIPSDLHLNADERQLVLVTGPNMAGKSTLMRQVAIIQILAQAGCFVPATKAELSLCDRVFTRVGASDDLAEGRSTFMVEMSETAHILRHATKHSLVLLDEIGRGTSTFDGLSIAWAVGEHIHDAVGARTLFATHYHELCDLAGALPRAKNIHVVVKEWNDRIIFTRTIAEGGAERSYGIQVARLAGLPAGVLARAREILAELEGDALHPKDDDSRPKPRAHRRTKKGPDDQMSLFMGGVEPAEANPFEKLITELAHVDANRTTPIDALNLLDTYVREARRLLKPVEKSE